MYGELWKYGHDIKKELIKAGFKVSDDCIVCYGDEGNTLGWKSAYEEISVIDYLKTKDLKGLSFDMLEKMAIIFYDKIENREWFLSKAK